MKGKSIKLSNLQYISVLIFATFIGLQWKDEYNFFNISQISSNKCIKNIASKYNFEVVKRQDKTFGADIYNFDTSEYIDNEEAMSSIRKLLEKHLVLVFHNMTITPEMQIKMAKAIGPINPATSSPPKYLEKGVFNSPQAIMRAKNAGVNDLKSSIAERMIQAKLKSQLPNEITIIVKEESDIAAFGEGAHSDLSYLAAPPLGAVLVARELPEAGQGNTHFWDMRAAFDKLPQNIKDRIDVLMANHTDGAGLGSFHPVVRHDNMYDRKVLYVNRAFTRNIIGEEDNELLDYLFQYIDDLRENVPESFLNVTWSEGQMVMWDNRFTQHAAQADYNTRREMHRVIISGNVPF